MQLENTRKLKKRQKTILGLKIKFSYSEKKEFEEIDGIIEDIESRIEGIEEAMSSCTSDYVKLQDLMDEKAKLDADLEEKMLRWEYLNELAEKINNQ